MNPSILHSLSKSSDSRTDFDHTLKTLSIHNRLSFHSLVNRLRQVDCAVPCLSKTSPSFYILSFAFFHFSIERAYSLIAANYESQSVLSVHQSQWLIQLNSLELHSKKKSLLLCRKLRIYLRSSTKSELLDHQGKWTKGYLEQ